MHRIIRTARQCIHSLREKCPNMEFFLVRIFLYSDQEKLRIWTLFTQRFTETQPAGFLDPPLVIERTDLRVRICVA